MRPTTSTLISPGQWDRQVRLRDTSGEMWLEYKLKLKQINGFFQTLPTVKDF